MSNPEKNSKPEDDTVTLNLASFAPGHKSSPSDPPPDESVTILIERAAEDVAKKNQASHPVISPKGSLPAKEMLGAVAYSYAKGVYRSEDIARKMESDTEFSAAAGDALPDANTIRKFRRLNRQAILDTLAQVFRRRRKKAVEEILTETMPGAAPANPPINNSEPAQPGETTLLSRRDAEEHINKAAFIDNMSKDD